MSRELDAKAKACEECGGSVPSQNRHFCSKQCRRKNRWMSLVCNHCGGNFSALRGQVERGQHKYCSHLCGELASRTLPAIEYMGVRYALNVHGYYRAQYPERLLHRVIWENAHGPIPSGFLVHHKSGVKTDNRLENLQMIEWGAHTTEHNRERHSKAALKALGEEEIIEMKICEAQHLFLRPGALYRFTVDPNCKKCLAATTDAYKSSVPGPKNPPRPPNDFEVG